MHRKNNNSPGAALMEVLRGEAVIQKFKPDGSPLDEPAATPGAAAPGAGQ